MLSNVLLSTILEPGVLAGSYEVWLGIGMRVGIACLKKIEARLIQVQPFVTFLMRYISSIENHGAIEERSRMAFRCCIRCGIGHYSMWEIMRETFIGDWPEYMINYDPSVYASSIENFSDNEESTNFD